MTIRPILVRELTALARAGRTISGRVWFAAFAALAVVGTFLVQAYWSHWAPTGAHIGVAARQAFRILVFFHATSCFALLSRGSLSIAGEKDRRTLDFLLTTQLSSADVIFGKLGSCLVEFVSIIAALAPFLGLLVALGGIDPRLILTLYCAVATSALALASLAIWVSTISESSKKAVNLSVGSVMLWWFLPSVLPFVLPILRIPFPWWLATPNFWLMQSGPVFVLSSSVFGGLSFVRIVDAVVVMCWLQVLVALVFTAASIVQLRSAHRTFAGADGSGSSVRVFGRRVPRRLRPDVGDDPIIWRERYTGRSTGFSLLLDRLIQLSIAGGFLYSTAYFAWPALLEVWRNGFASGFSGPEPPELNLFVRMMFPGSVAQTLDSARIAFNVFIRISSLTTALFIAVCTPGFAAQSILNERAKETWTSLIATPLSAFEILRSKFIVTLWRLRKGVVALLVLWTLGLATGSLHPVGFALALALLTAWTGCLVTIGLMFGLRQNTAQTGGNSLLSLSMLLWTCGFLPYLLPKRFSSVLLGFPSLLFDLWLGLVSYKDFGLASPLGRYLPLEWMRILSGENGLQAAAALLIGVTLPVVLGLAAWHYSVTHFDSLVGRPFRDKGKRDELAYNSVQTRATVPA